MPTRSSFPKAQIAVVLIDVANPFDFAGGAAFARRAGRVARRDRLRIRAAAGFSPPLSVNT